MSFEHCHFCKPPVRHAGYHSDCPYYAADIAARSAAKEEKRRLTDAKCDWLRAPIQDAALSTTEMREQEKMITEMELGHRIRDLRKKKGLSQLSFAADIDAPQSTVASWETGRCYPRLESLGRLERVFGVPVSSLLLESGAPKGVPTEQEIGKRILAWRTIRGMTLACRQGGRRADHDVTVRLLLALEDLTGLTFREMFGECEGRDGRV